MLNNVEMSKLWLEYFVLVCDVLGSNPTLGNC